MVPFPQEIFASRSYTSLRNGYTTTSGRARTTSTGGATVVVGQCQLAHFIFSVSSSAIANTLFGLCQLLLPAYFTRTEPLMESAVICAEPSPLTTRALSEPGSSRSANSPSSHTNPPDT